MSISDKIILADTEIINNAEEAQTFFESCISHGEEGAMMKNMNQRWEPKRVKGIGKMKSENDADLIIIGFEEGTGKNVGKLGALICETSDKLLRVNVGTGFSDYQRSLIWLNKDNYFGQIATVMYNQKISSKGKESASLFLPRFVDVRFDKTGANSYEELK